MTDTMNNVRIYLMRHGRTMLNASDSVQGWSDSPLTPTGERSSEYAGIGLKDTLFDAIYSSDSGRAMQTAHHVMSENKISPQWELHTKKELRELCFGHFEGGPNQAVWDHLFNDFSEEEVNEMTLPEYINYAAQLETRTRPHGFESWPAENYNHYATRLKQAFHKIGQRALANGEENILVVSHGMSIKAILGEFSDHAVKMTDPVPDNNSVTILEYDGENFTIERFNDTSYLETGRQVVEG